MADKKISELNTATQVQATDVLPIVSNSANFKVSTAMLGNWIIQNYGTPKKVWSVATTSTLNPLAGIIELTQVANTLATAPVNTTLTIVNSSNLSMTVTTKTSVSNAQVFTLGQQGSTLSLLSDGNRWFVTSAYNIT